MGTSKYLVRNNLLRLSAIIVFLHSQAAVAVDETYINAIKADVAEFSSGTFDSTPDNAWASGSASAVLDGTASLASFEKYLKKLLPGTFILFNKLSTPQKTLVWQDYVKTGDIKTVRKNIFSSFRSGS